MDSYKMQCKLKPQEFFDPWFSIGKRELENLGDPCFSCVLERILVFLWIPSSNPNLMGGRGSFPYTILFDSGWGDHCTNHKGIEVA